MQYSTTYFILFIAFLAPFPDLTHSIAAQDDLKAAVGESIEHQFSDLTELSDKIWSYEEIAFQETQSAEALKEYARANGFRIEENIGGMPTAFTAEFGSGKPVIGILGEFDALPGLSQETVPHKQPLHEGSAGHGCGHNLFGTASLGAATAIKELIESGDLGGTIRFYGTPAEERFFGKLWMIRAGA
ncbi:MAG: M20/M25/M40 family metallo-hydrolase, partial [Lewinella sp.]